ncbi:SDR family oxidoreductase [Streptomyces sp. NPDC007088]|uniref:SDR family oxidoreductase n=1 Tax=Streptomyces sp. NPDC007088 TaxID=3364773 RepID=UPI003682F3DC
MKIAVVGGTGLIGTKVVAHLRAGGHDAVALARATGTDVQAGTGLLPDLEGADVCVNLTNSPTFDAASVDFFRTSMDNILQAGLDAGVRHQLLLSIVGVDQVPDLDYYRAKTVQEEVLKQGPAPWSIVRATQFFEFVESLMSYTTEGEVVRLPSTPLQPIAAADVVEALVETALGGPTRSTLDVAGPEVHPLDELGRLTLAARPDGRTVVTDDAAGLFSAVPGAVLTAGPDARVAPTRYGDWLRDA